MNPRVGAAGLTGLFTLAAARSSAQGGASFRIEDHDRRGPCGVSRRALTCALVERYLARIAAYDKTGPALNALVVVNPRAVEVADSLDRRFRAAAYSGPLHCIPTIVKDNFETVDLPVTVGSLARGIRVFSRRLSGTADSGSGGDRSRQIRTWPSLRSVPLKP